MKAPQCCYLAGGRPDGRRCSNEAEWQIWHGGGPDDYTESCTEHVGVMLTDAPEHKVYGIPTGETYVRAGIEAENEGARGEP